LQSIQSAGDYVNVTDRSESALELLPEGAQMAENGSHEFVFWSNVPEGGISQGDAMKNIKNAKVGMGKALAAKWISKNKGKSIASADWLILFENYSRKMAPFDTLISALYLRLRF